jgi:hypothetical protein
MKTIVKGITYVSAFFVGALTTFGALSLGATALVAFIVSQLCTQGLIWGLAYTVSNS